MQRCANPPRPDWRARLEAEGFTFHTFDGEPYWVDDVHYRFTLRQIEDDLEAATAELHAMCVDLVDGIVGDELKLRRLRVPRLAWEAIRDSWKRRDPSLYGRFDLAYGGEGPARLLEYNADTPTALYETGYVQWRWLEDQIAAGVLPGDADQFNSVHDRLVATLGRIAGGAPLHLTCMADQPEDRGTVAYLEDCAAQAGLATTFLPLDAIGLLADGAFADAQDRPIQRLFKLYPWEWMFAEPFGERVAASPTRFVEPPWKALLSNKGVLALLWEAHPGHPNLLPAFIESDARHLSLGTSFARKPLFSREGANVLLVRDGAVLDRDEGPYGREGFVRQALATIPRFGQAHAVIGSWVVGDEPAGVCIREDDGPITRNTSRFVPHAIVD